MTQNENEQTNFLRRKTLRLRNYDYGLSGCYFVTVCTQNRKHYFGEISGTTFFPRPNAPHLMIESWLKEAENKFAHVTIDPYIVMPNHVHFIAEKTDSRNGPPLHRIVEWFKTMTTNAYIRNVRQGLYQPFEKRLWQRSYYERVIRNEQEYHDIGEYILHNPENWAKDAENQ